jgi:CheY-like chemotaxis protein
MPLLALVIDDSMLIRHTVCRILQKLGFAVETATDGADALEVLKTIRPDVIFTDLQMPRLSGYELIEALKNNAETAGIPVLVIAARLISGDAPETRAHSVIYKDLNIDVQLRQALESLFPSNATTSSSSSQRE